MKKILVIRFSALGDIAMSVPVIHDLAVQYPELDVTMLSREMARPLFEQMPKNVHFIAADLEGRHKGLLGLCRLWREAHLSDFDYIADFHGVLRTWWLRTEGCLHRKKVAKINKGRKGKRALIREKNKVIVQQATSFERYAKVLEQLSFPIKPQFSKLDYSCFCEMQKPNDEKWIGIAPFAKHEAKVYPLDKMEQVIKTLSERGNTTVFLFGGGIAENELIERLCANYDNVRSAKSQQGLKGELALMGQLDVMLSMDSANTHLASLVGTRVVSVWGGTHPYAGFLGWNQKTEDCVQLDLPCRPCSVYGNKPCLRGNYACMNGISPSQILEKLMRS